MKEMSGFKPFKVEMKDLHCNVYFLFLKEGSHKQQVNQAMRNLQKFIVVSDQNKMLLKDLIDKMFTDCSDNPGFTFELSTGEVCIAFRPYMFANQLDAYFISILAHEISHAFTFCRDTLGMEEEDELRSIEIGNMMEAALQKLGIKFSFANKRA